LLQEDSFMDIRTFIKGIIESFFITFTCATLGLVVLSHILGATSTPLRDIAAIFIVSVLTALTGFVLYTRRESKRPEMIIRLAIQLLLVLVITLSIASYMLWVLWSRSYTVIVFVSMVVVIFVSVHAIIYYQTKKLTDDLNKKLKERYKK
jgi:hypothetical protein